MANSDNSFYSIPQLIRGLGRILKFIFKNSWILFAAIILGLLIALGVFKIRPHQYLASATFLIQEKDGSSSSGLSGVASSLGLDVGSAGVSSSSLFAGDNILDILKSKLIVKKVLLTMVPTQMEGSRDSVSLADLYLDFTGLRKKWRHSSSELRNLDFKSVPVSSESLSFLRDSVLEIIYNGFAKKNLSVDHLSKKGTLFTIQVISPNQIFSKFMVERLVEKSRQLYISLKTQTETSNVDRLQHKADSIHDLLSSSTVSLAKRITRDSIMSLNNRLGVTSYIPDRNPMFRPKMPLHRISGQLKVKENDVMVLQAVYSEVVKDLEASKVALSQQTPVIQLLDRPSFPLEDEKHGFVFFLIIGVVLGGFFGLIFEIVFYYWQKVKDIEFVKKQ